MSKEIFAKNIVLAGRFIGWENWDDVDDIVQSDDETEGIASYNGVLCWYNDGWAGYAEDTEQNREIALALWEDAIAEVNEYL